MRAHPMPTHCISVTGEPVGHYSAFSAFLPTLMSPFHRLPSAALAPKRAALCISGHADVLFSITGFAVLFGFDVSKNSTLQEFVNPNFLGF